MRKDLILIALGMAAAVPAQADEALVAHIQRCWMPPPDAEVPLVRLHVVLDAEGEVVETETLEAPKTAAGERALEAARRAVFRCAPYDGFGAEGEAALREFEVTFVPPDG